MRSSPMCALGLAATFTLAACSSSQEAPGSSDASANAGGNASTGGDSSTGAAGSVGVSGDATGGGGTDSMGGSGGTQSIVDGSAAAPDGQTCDAITAKHDTEGNQHSMSLCVPLVYLTNPPSSGTHYGVWAAYKTYTKPFLPGFWVHNLEHGAMVITYNCPGGCAAELAEAQAFIDSLPTDCPAAVNAQKRRIIMLPDPELDVRFAASAWNAGPIGAVDAVGFTLRASCFDRAAFAKFYTDHYGRGLEPVCDDGYDPLTAAAGGKPICP